MQNLNDKLEMPLEQFAEAVAKENARLTEEIARLKKKCDMQANMLRSLAPDKFPGTPFIHMSLGNRDINGMPEKLAVVPAYGVDFSYIYEYNGKTVGSEW